ncbi:cytochrome P450 [Roridomyces roridus]|uniref:Cytochrome P450 n=1 Tax=Roridomyces roridus TaxID=1738132 RepID=A0AAD7BCR1_9AGAR|nr:cytochrome P450 [Roridomyces roridus]
MSLRLLATVASTLLCAQVTKLLVQWVSKQLYSPLREMPGPPSPSLLFGNFGKLSFRLFQRWQAQYGPTFRYHAIFRSHHLFTADAVALHHIVNNPDVYEKGEMVRYALTQLLGRGLLALEGDEHTKLRKIMSPAFGPSQIRGLTELFLDKSIELRDVWTRSPADPTGWIPVDVFEGLKRMTLDVIGLAGFAYEFHALKESTDEQEKRSPLEVAFREFFMDRQGEGVGIDLRIVLRAMFPLLRAIVPPHPKMLAERKTMDKVGLQLLQEAKTAIVSGDKDSERRDLLSLLVQSNISEQESHRVSDQDVVAQLPTFFAAGHETTSTATSWALYALARAPDIQEKLRAELTSMGTDSPSLDALNGLPYLEKFVREVMRVYGPVAFTNRVATRDDIIPLGTPYTDTRGVKHDSVSVKKGQFVRVPVGAVNQDPRIWGEDAAEFNPDRWDSIPSAASEIPGVGYAHLFTFLGGPHNCIGWRFAIAETKALVYTLVRGFEFALALDEGDGEEVQIRESVGAIRRPEVVKRKVSGSWKPWKGYEATEAQLPMRVRRI